MKFVWLPAALLLVALQSASAQSVRSLVNGGNDLYKDHKFTDAEVNYRKALEKEKNLVQGHFNLGDALAQQGKNDEAAKEFEQALKDAEQRDTRAHAYYNIGNTQLAAQQYADAVRSYIEALKLNPKDDEAKYNLSYALEKLRQPPPQKNQQKQNKNDKNQNKQDQNKQNQNQDQNKDKNQQKKPDRQQNNPQQQQKRMSKADAERILEVLKNSEKDVQKKLHTRPAERPKTDKDW